MSIIKKQPMTILIFCIIYTPFLILILCFKLHLLAKGIFYAIMSSIMAPHKKMPFVICLFLLWFLDQAIFYAKKNGKKRKNSLKYC